MVDPIRHLASFRDLNLQHRDDGNESPNLRLPFAPQAHGQHPGAGTLKVSSRRGRDEDSCAIPRREPECWSLELERAGRSPHPRSDVAGKPRGGHGRAPVGKEIARNSPWRSISGHDEPILAGPLPWRAVVEGSGEGQASILSVRIGQPDADGNCLELRWRRHDRRHGAVRRVDGDLVVPPDGLASSGRKHPRHELGRRDHQVWRAPVKRLGGPRDQQMDERRVNHAERPGMRQRGRRAKYVHRLKWRRQIHRGGCGNSLPQRLKRRGRRRGVEP